jgi:glucose/mannose transport system permease protein
MKAGLLPKLLLSPSALLVLVCVYGYIMFTVYLSFTTSTMLPSAEWAGTANYQRLLGLENWEVSLRNLAIFASLYIVVAMVLGLLLAILLDQKVRAEGVLRSIYLYPMALSLIVTGTAWKWMLNPGLGIEHTLPRAWAGPSFSFDWIKAIGDNGDLLRGDRRRVADRPAS